MREDLQIRIARLKQMMAECPLPASMSDEAKHILKTAPQMLGDMERTIQSGSTAALAQVAALIEHSEGYIHWAVDEAKGTEAAEAIKAGREADPTLPAEQRLMNRLMRFLATRVDRSQFAALARAFAGEDAVEGNQIHMDPIGETEAFSQWLIHDVELPGASTSLIESFAQEETDHLLEDERPLLAARLHDRPSIYQVTKLSKHRKTHRPKENYWVQDLLSTAEVICITDRATSRKLHKGSIFMGRAIPIDRRDDHFQLLGTITELPATLWARLSGIIEGWKAEFQDQHPDATMVTFYRAHHARLVRTIAELTCDSPSRH